MPDVRFYMKQAIYVQVLAEAAEHGLTEREYLQKIFEEAYAIAPPATS